MGKTMKIFLGIVALAIILIWARTQGWIGSSTDYVEVEVVEVNVRDLVEVVTTSGKIRPAQEVKIAPEVSGEIFELFYREGDMVNQGDLLVKINPDLYQSAEQRAKAATNNARAGLSQAKAQFIEAERNYKRNKTLFDKGVISELEFDGIQRAYDVARLGVEAAEFQVQSARATEREAQDNLKRTKIYAPASGTISMLNVEVGERVVGTAQMAGTELLRVANLDRMQVKVEVNENEVIKVNVGDSASIQVEAYPDEKFYGKVAHVAIASRENQAAADQITVFEVLVDINPKSYEHMARKHPLRHGMTATVDIITRQVFGVPAVPVQSVTTRSDSTGDNSQLARLRRSATAEAFPCVFVINNGVAEMRRVQIGIQDDSFLEIISGLQTGEKIVSGPFSAIAQELKNNSEIEIRKK